MICRPPHHVGIARTRTSAVVGRRHRPTRAHNARPRRFERRRPAEGLVEARPRVLRRTRLRPTPGRGQAAGGREMGVDGGQRRPRPITRNRSSRPMFGHRGHRWTTRSSLPAYRPAHHLSGLRTGVQGRCSSGRVRGGRDRAGARPGAQRQARPPAPAPRRRSTAATAVPNTRWEPRSRARVGGS